jgi:predicted GIY-YIG superfamily endonuclease
MPFTLYILLCGDETLYVGHTDDMVARLQQHDSGFGSAYTASRRPLKLLHAEEFDSRYEALVMERKLKGWSRAKKIAYIRGDWSAVRQLAKGKHKHQKA